MNDLMEEQKALIGQLNRIFPGEDITELKRLSSARNRVYLAKTSELPLVIKCAPLTSCDSLHREYQAISQLHTRGGPVPRPVSIINDGIQYQVTLNKQDYIVRGYEYIQGKQLLPSKETFYALGVSIGNLHNAWHEVDRPIWVPEVTVSDLIFEPIEWIIKQYTDRDKIPVVNQLGRSVADVLEAHRDLDLLGFTHGDVHHFNAIRTNNDEIVLIDLEDMSWQWRAYDLATAIWGTFGRGGSAPVWNELIAGYSSIRSLSQEEAMLIRFLIFARHLWWLGLHARNWENWPQRYTRKQFFGSGIQLLMTIGHDVCGLKGLFMYNKL